MKRYRPTPSRQPTSAYHWTPSDGNCWRGSTSATLIEHRADASRLHSVIHHAEAEVRYLDGLIERLDSSIASHCVTATKSHNSRKACAGEPLANRAVTKDTAPIVTIVAAPVAKR